MERYTYPAAPGTPVTIAVSPGFRKQATKVIASIALFCAVYIILVIAVLALAFAAAYYGLALIINFPRWITLLLGAGMIATGISLVFFVVKFIGTVAKSQDAGRWEITEKDHPVLFDFLAKVAKETQTPFPKKVFVSPDVNAAVFYDSSFLSMFLPVKKNLVIGLGLVNSINLSEFKAVIAHEFGHFSQRSMKVGSYTYNVNLVLYNMLYENTSYTKFLNQWGNLHGLLSIFATITVKISLFIQWILRGMYGLINKEYMALSREMEFHADGIAASVAGGNNLVTALSHIGVADSCYQKAIQDANELVEEKKQLRNIFYSQSYIFQLAAEQFQLPLNNGLPEISYSFANSTESSRINIKNQWASHPTLQERKESLDLLGINIPPVTSSPWILFNNPEEVQQSVTNHLYETVTFDNQPGIVDAAAYEKWINVRRENKSLPLAYKGFYDGRYINLQEDELNTGEYSSKSFDDIFTKENGKLQSQIENTRRDLNIVKAIQEKQIEAKSFDFDGQKFLAQHSDIVIEQLQTDLEDLEKKQAQLDKEAFVYFYKKAENPGMLQQRYKAFIDRKKFISEYETISNEIGEVIQRISQVVSLEQASAEAQRLKEIGTTVIKPSAATIFDKYITKEANEELYNKAVVFQTKDYHYFSGNAFIENEISDLLELNALMVQTLIQHLFIEYKSLLEYQLAEVSKKEILSYNE